MQKNLSSELLSRLREEGLHLSTAESCTGGLLGGALTAIPGSSDTYNGGIISYTNAVKMSLLGVPETLLEALGAVSGPVAEAMAQGCCKAAKADVGLSTTGLAGPGGDDRGNPVGTVWIGCAVRGRVISRCYHFEGDRDSVRSQAVTAALELALGELGKN